jgi:hypothetical protein
LVVAFKKSPEPTGGPRLSQYKEARHALNRGKVYLHTFKTLTRFKTFSGFNN